MATESILSQQDTRVRAEVQHKQARMLQEFGDIRAVNDIAEMQIGGERGIRTLDTVSRIHAFQASALSHSAISPCRECGAL